MKSLLSVFDINTGLSKNVLTVDGHIEAPNWTPDGAALIVNGNGRLFRVPLDEPELQPMDTGFAHQLNNVTAPEPTAAAFIPCRSPVASPYG